MIRMRTFLDSDIPVLRLAIAADTFHQGEWAVEHFTINHPRVYSTVIEDDKGPIAFVVFTIENDQLRLACVWNDATDSSRNARSIVFGVREAVDIARACRLKGLIIASKYPPLGAFLERILKMTKVGDEYVLAV